MKNQNEVVAIYVRLSEEDKDKKNEIDDSLSIQNQKSMLISYALERGWEVYNIYSDDDYAGADRNRPEFKKLIEDAEQGKFNIVLCKSQSRFTRELEIVEKYIHGYFMLWEIRFIGVVDNADTDVKGNKKSRQINGLVNEWYLEDLSQNIKDVLTDRRKKGYHIGSFSLYGYMKDPMKKGHLIKDPVAAEVVHEIFEMYAAGIGKISIARILNQKGIPNPMEYKRLCGLRYREKGTENSKLWKYFSITSTLKNEMYIGNLVQGKYKSISYKSKITKPTHQDEWIRVEGTHEPIIEKELWDKVQKLIQINAKPFSNGDIGIWAGKTRCMYCAYTMLQKKTRQYRYLDCGTKYAAPNACIGSHIPIRELEKAVLEELRILIQQYLDMDKAEQLIQIQNNKQEKITKLEREIKQYITKIDELKRGLSQSYLDKVKGIITEQEYIDYASLFREDIQRYEKLSTISKEHLTYALQEQNNNLSKREVLEKYINIKELNRDIVLTLINYIEIGKRKNKTDSVPIKIHWNF